MKRKLSESHRRALSESHKGLRHSAETRRKLSLRLIGNRRSAKPFTQEHKDRISASVKESYDDELRSTRSAQACDNAASGRSFKFKGTHFSTKMQMEIRYRSKLERRVMRILDLSPDVVSWSYESLRVEVKSKFHVPDFVAELADGSTVVIEAKGGHLVRRFLNSKKYERILKFVLSRNWSYQIVSDRKCDLGWVI